MVAATTWRIDDNISQDQRMRIQEEDTISELTISRVYIPISKSGDKVTFRFFNTDPKNWNLFMFPFESKKIRRKIDSDFVAKNATDISAIIGIEGAEFLDFSDDRISTQLEIKFSKSSGLNTLYVFLYRVVDPDEATFDFESRDISFKTSEDARSYFRKHGSEFASNVPDVVMEVLKGE